MEQLIEALGGRRGAEVYLGPERAVAVVDVAAGATFDEEGMRALQAGGCDRFVLECEHIGDLALELAQAFLGLLKGRWVCMLHPEIDSLARVLRMSTRSLSEVGGVAGEIAEGIRAMHFETDRASALELAGLTPAAPLPAELLTRVRTAADDAPLRVAADLMLEHEEPRASLLRGLLDQPGLRFEGTRPGPPSGRDPGAGARVVWRISGTEEVLFAVR